MFTACNKDTNDTCSNENEKSITSQHPQSSIPLGLPELEVKKLEAKANLAEQISCISQTAPEILTLFNNLASETQSIGYYEHEFFWNLKKDEPRNELNGKSISDIFILNSESNIDLLDFICKYIPELTILQPIDTLTGILQPNIFSTKIFYDNHFDDSDPRATIPYFDSCIEGSMVHSEVEKIPTFIVRESETFLSRSEIDSGWLEKTIADTTFLGTVCGEDIIVYSPVPPDPPGPPPGPGCVEPCDRDCISGKENISQLRARNNYESWLKGKGEFMFYAIWADGIDYTYENGSLVINGNPLTWKRSVANGVDDDNQWMYVNLDQFRWDKETDGTRMKYVLYEQDKGWEVNIPVTLKATIDEIEIELSTNIQIHPFDDFIGESIVDWCDRLDFNGNGIEYHPSSDVDFYINRR